MIGLCSLSANAARKQIAHMVIGESDYGLIGGDAM